MFVVAVAGASEHATELQEEVESYSHPDNQALQSGSEFAVGALEQVLEVHAEKFIGSLVHRIPLVV